MDIIHEYEDDLITYVADKLIKTDQADGKHLEYNAIERVLSYFSDLHYRHIHVREDDRLLRMEYVEKRFKIEHIRHMAYCGCVLPSGFMPSLKAEINKQIQNLKMNPDNKEVA